MVRISLIVLIPFMLSHCSAIKLVAESGNQQVTLTWPFENNVKKYDILWKDSDAKDWGQAKVITAATSPYLHKDLTNGKRYCYRLSVNLSWLDPVCATASVWQTIHVEGGGIFNRVASDGVNKIVATTLGGAIWSSVDNGITWAKTRDADGHTGGLKGIAYGGGTFVAVGNKGDRENWGTILTSTDAINWTKNPLQVSDINTINYSNGQFFFYKYDKIYFSSDGISWAYGFTNPSILPDIITECGNQYVGTLSHTSMGAGVILISLDTLNWTSYIVGTDGVIWHTVYDGAKYIAVGTDKTIQTSTDLVSWTPRLFQNSIARDDLKKIAFNGSHYVTVGNFGYIFTSIDGISWNPSATDFARPGDVDSPNSLAQDLNYDYVVLTLDLYDVIWDGSKSIVVGYDSITSSGIILIATLI